MATEKKADVKLTKEEAEKAAAVSLAEATIHIMDELTLLMSDEGNLLGPEHGAEHKDLLQRKQRLTMDYRANIKTIAAEPAMLKLLSDELRASLKASGQKLADVTDRNAKILRGAVLATQRLIQNIVALVKKEVMPKTSYSDPTNIQSMLGSYSPTCKPVAVNRTA